MPSLQSEADFPINIRWTEEQGYSDVPPWSSLNEKTLNISRSSPACSIINKKVRSLLIPLTIRVWGRASPNDQFDRLHLLSDLKTWDRLLGKQLQEDHTAMNAQPSRRIKETKPRAPAGTPAPAAIPTDTSTHQPVSPCDDPHILIAKRAYELYNERGYRHGSALDDWLEAEREILSQIPPV